MNKEKPRNTHIIILDITITRVLLLWQLGLFIIYYISINNFMMYFIYDFLNGDIISNAIR